MLTHSQQHRLESLQAVGFARCRLPPEDLKVSARDLVASAVYRHGTQFVVVAPSGRNRIRKTVWRSA
jgi:hypothetical protein